MRKKLLIGCGLLALFAAGAGLGMFVQYRIQLRSAAAAAQPYLDIFRGFVEGEHGPAPPFEHWRYPGATEKGSGRGPSLEVNGRMVRPAMQYVLFTTADDYAKVAAYYGTKLGFEVDSGFGLRGLRIANSTKAGFQLKVTDGNAAGPSGQPPPVRVLCLRQTCGSYDVVVFITRAEKEADTHVVLLYQPKAAGPAPAQ